MTTGKAAGAFAFFHSTGSHGSAPVAAEPYATSELVREYLVLKALSSTSPAMPAELEKAHATAFAAVCDGVRTRTIVLDYEPEESGCVDMPPVSHPHYMQALLFWCAELRCPLSRLVEAHARIGQFASRSLLLEMLVTIENEDTLPSTSFDSTYSWRDAPRTIPLPPPPRDKKEDEPPVSLL